MSELLTVEECAAKAKCSPRTIKRQILAGKLKATRIGSLVRIRAGDWEEYLCRSGDTVPAGKSGFSTAGDDIARLLRLAPTRNISKQGSGSGSTIHELAERLATRSKKPSLVG
jgi:excisionase family DNA binding protein